MTGIAVMLLSQAALAEGIAQDVDALEAQVAMLETENAELRAILEELVALQRCHAQGGSAGNRYDADNDWVGGVDWRGCDKRGIMLLGYLAGGDQDDGSLFNADLRGTDFTRAHLIGVHMNGANLEGANFTNANLHYSDLTGANIISLDQAQQYGRAQTIFSNTTCPDGTNSDDNEGTCANNRTQ